MIETVFSSEAVAVGDRFDFWREHLAQAYAPAELSSDHASDFRVSDRVLTLGTTTVIAALAPTMMVRRTSKLIRQSDPEAYHLTLARRGTLSITPRERFSRPNLCHAYDLVVLDTSRPIDIHVKADDGRVPGLAALVPRSLLPLPAGRADALFARQVSGREGIASLLVGFLVQLTEDTRSYGPADGPRLGTVLVDLVTALFAQLLEAEGALGTEARQRTLILRIQEFIQQNLTDPQLSPGTVAAAHHISLSYLHRLFRERDTTVASSIRRQRLERCYRDLTDSSMSALAIHAIAARWGFSDTTHFSRVFRHEYGMTPRDCRKGEGAGTV
ncbi:helix-turn-helix domain-containing protein (plasmid) [Embleya sp. NBC_00888]|uniref:helix-turn-helix domain-containing protein n=1 Tax=Embleya sp. NBC_00888 TaxID=2975960 RepID=UPI002F91AA62|nr:helix-turn-helix domain-containing protein [Embleya sp. NBC_00888]